MPVVSSKSFEIVNANTRRGKGPLVKVEISPGRFVKMYRADAEAQGLVPQGDKLRSAEGDKGASPPSTGSDLQSESGSDTADSAENGGDEAAILAAVPGEGDDLTEIDGVGPATARVLTAAGITTFGQLKAAGREGLERVVSGSALAAIVAWQASTSSATGGEK